MASLREQLEEARARMFQRQGKKATAQAQRDYLALRDYTQKISPQEWRAAMIARGECRALPTDNATAF